MRRGVKLHRLDGPGGDSHRRAENDLAEMPAQGSLDRLGGMVAEGDFDTYVRMGFVRQSGGNKGVLEGDRAARAEIDAAPDAGIAPADHGNPIPADGGVIGGVVGSERAAVLIGTLESLLPDAARRGVLEDAHGQGVGCAGMEAGGNVETSAHESAIDAAQEFPVEVDVGLPVDAVEVEPEMAAGANRGSDELGAVPEVGPEE